LLPISIAMLAGWAVGCLLSWGYSVRGLVRTGLVFAVLSILVLLATVDPELSDGMFAVSMAGLGVGMGLMASQLGNVVQSSVDSSGRGEAGGLQYTGQQLGSSLGVALIGAIVLTGLASVFVRNVATDERLPTVVTQQVGIAVESGLDFLSTDQLAAAAAKAGLDPASATALVEDYADAQITSLKVGLLAAAVRPLGSIPFTRNLPHGDPRPGSGEGTGSRTVGPEPARARRPTDRPTD
jgi:hypothetical protein